MGIERAALSSGSQLPVEEIVTQLSKFPPQTFTGVAEIRQFLVERPVDPASIEPYLFWDLQHYTRNLIAKNELFELIAICWEPGQGSSVHNHRGQNCWMMAPIGRLRVQNYRVREQDLARSTCQIERTDIVEISPANPMAVDPAEPVHKVYNPREFGGRAVSLHIYSRPFDSCDVYSEEKQTCGQIKLHYTSEFGVPTGIRLS